MLRGYYSDLNTARSVLSGRIVSQRRIKAVAKNVKMGRYRNDRFASAMGGPTYWGIKYGAKRAAKWYRGRRGSAMAKATKALRIANRIQRTAEVKLIEIRTNQTVAVGGNAGEAKLMNPLAIGTTDVTRQANYATMKSISIVGTLSSISDALVRVVLVIDRDPDGVLAAWDDVFKDDDAAQMYNVRSNKGRFRILRDDKINLANQDLKAWFKYHVTFKGGLVTNYSRGNAGTIADIAQNSIILMVNSVLNGDTVIMDGESRVRYTDD